MTARARILDLREVDHRHAQLLEFRCICRPHTGHAPGNPAREAQSAVVLRDEDEHVVDHVVGQQTDLRLEEVEVDVGRGEDDVVEPPRAPQVAGKFRIHEAFHRQERAHGMRQDVEPFRPRAREDLCHLLDLHARDERAVEVVDIARHLRS